MEWYNYIRYKALIIALINGLQFLIAAVVIAFYYNDFMTEDCEKINRYFVATEILSVLGIVYGLRKYRQITNVLYEKEYVLDIDAIVEKLKNNIDKIILNSTTEESKKTLLELKTLVNGKNKKITVSTNYDTDFGTSDEFYTTGWQFLFMIFMFIVYLTIFSLQYKEVNDSTCKSTIALFSIINSTVYIIMLCVYAFIWCITASLLSWMGDNEDEGRYMLNV